MEGGDERRRWREEMRGGDEGRKIRFVAADRVLTVETSARGTILIVRMSYFSWN